MKLVGISASNVVILTACRFYGKLPSCAELRFSPQVAMPSARSRHGPQGSP